VDSRPRHSPGVDEDHAGEPVRGVEVTLGQRTRTPRRDRSRRSTVERACAGRAKVGTGIPSTCYLTINDAENVRDGVGTGVPLAAINATRIIGPMCEHYVARSAGPFRLDELWPFTERLERFGIAGWGWGAAWATDDGRLCSYRDIRAFRDDPGREEVGGSRRQAALVHLRRPSKLSTLGIPDTPSPSTIRPAGSRSATTAIFASSRRGGRSTATRGGSTQGGHRGRRALAGGSLERDATGTMLAELHDVFHGQANLATISAGATSRPTPATRRTRCSRSAWAGSGSPRPGSTRSTDRSSFRRPERPSVRLVRVGDSVSLDRNGGRTPAS
jgi:hypothetical protein